MKEEDIKKAIEKAMEKGLGEDFYIMITGKQLNKITNTQDYEDDEIYEIKSGKITKVNTEVNLDD